MVELGRERIDNQLYHPCLYWDKAKARIWTGGGGLQSPTAPYPKRASGRRIQTPEDLVKYKEENNLSFSMEKASLKALNVLRTRADVGEEALELRIPMSSFGENQRLRVTSERQDRSPDYPDTAASSPNEHMMREKG